jgi:hypothetical protein
MPAQPFTPLFFFFYFWKRKDNKAILPFENRPQNPARLKKEKGGVNPPAMIFLFNLPL